jgi:hypothetical protein
MTVAELKTYVSTHLAGVDGSLAITFSLGVPGNNAHYILTLRDTEPVVSSELKELRLPIALVRELNNEAALVEAAKYHKVG